MLIPAQGSASLGTSQAAASEAQDRAWLAGGGWAGGVHFRSGVLLLGTPAVSQARGGGGSLLCCRQSGQGSIQQEGCVWGGALRTPREQVRSPGQG